VPHAPGPAPASPVAAVGPSAEGWLDALALTSAEFAEACVRAGCRGGRTGAIEAYRRLYREGALPVDQPAPRIAPVARRLESESPEGPVVKFTQAVGAPSPAAARQPLSVGERDGVLETESVLIPMIGKKGLRTYTLCVSSQVGCAMGCTFCETAQMGLIRSLTAGEIVQQWFAARHEVGLAPKNIVFMGMGEPMDNLDQVLRAIAVLTDHNGAAVPMNKITVSTVGRLDGIRRLAEQVRRPGWHRLNLAVSVNAPDDATRSAIMPINRAAPLAALGEELRRWPRFGGGAICLEYVLIPGVNDTREHAAAMAEFARPLHHCVNVIPYNPRRDSPWPAPREEDVDRFLAWLLAAGAYAKRRRTKGREMMGACGQLGNPEIQRKPLAPKPTSLPILS